VQHNKRKTKESKTTPAKKEGMKEGKTMRANLVKTDSKTRAMIDSGANVNVTKKEIADKYDIEITQTREQDSVKFGKKGSKSKIKGYGRFGHMIGQAGSNSRRHKRDNHTCRHIHGQRTGSNI